LLLIPFGAAGKMATRCFKDRKRDRNESGSSFSGFESHEINWTLYLKDPAFMRLEFKFIIGSFVYLFVLPLIGSHARGERQGLLAWRQPSFLLPQSFYYEWVNHWAVIFFLGSPGVKYVSLRTVS